MSIVGSTNRAPEADAGAERVVEVGEAVRLDARASRDADGDTLAFAWVLVSGPEWVSVDSATTSRARVQLPARGTYVFRVTVTDPTGASASDDVRLVAVPTGAAAPANRAPVADARADRAVDVGTTVALDATSSTDADGDPLSYFWIQVEGPGVAIADAGLPVARIRPVEAGTYVLRVVVVDGRGGSATDDVRVTVRGSVSADPANQPPLAAATGPAQVVVDDEAVLDASSSQDPEGGSLAYAWIQVTGPAAVAVAAADGPAARVRPSLPGVYVFRVTVTDPEGASAAVEVRLTAVPRVGQVDIEGVFETGGAG